MWFCSDGTSTYISNFSPQQHITWSSCCMVSALQSFCMIRHLQFSNKHRASFFCVWSRLLERTLCQVQSEHCVEKQKTKYILNNTERERERERRCIPLRTNQQHMHLVGLWEYSLLSHITISSLCEWLFANYMSFLWSFEFDIKADTDAYSVRTAEIWHVSICSVCANPCLLLRLLASLDSI